MVAILSRPQRVKPFPMEDKDRLLSNMVNTVAPDDLATQWTRASYSLVIGIANFSQNICPHSRHDDVIKWKHFPRYWPFVRGIHRSPVNSPHKSQWRGALMFSLICALNKRLSKQSWGWLFETPSRPLWRHCNEQINSYRWLGARL